MTKPILILLAIVMLTRCTSTEKDYTLTNENFSRELTQLRDYFHIPGLAVIIKKGDHTVYEDYVGFADLQNQTAMDSTTTIPMASLTKMFTGVLAMQLVEEGKLSLDESINKYVSGENNHPLCYFILLIFILNHFPSSI